MGVDAGGGGRAMSEILLNKAQVDAGLQQMPGPGMTPRMDRGPFVDATVFEGGAERVLNAAAGHGLGGRRQTGPSPTGRREDPDRGAMSDPRLPKQVQRPLRQRDVAIFAAFALPDVDHHASAVDIGDLKTGSLLKPQTTGVDGGQADAVAGESDAAQNPSDLFQAQDHRQLLFAWRANKPEGGPVALEGLFEEELDATQRDGAGAARVVFDVLDREEVLSEFFLGDHVGGFVIVLRQLAHGPDVHLLCALGQAPELESLDHSLTKFGHGYTSFALDFDNTKYREPRSPGAWSDSLRGAPCSTARSA
jgi:hypothetical protein